ncbi:MAG TPA: ferritin-like domain-containing protein [Noviherbaspirillum sp.]
MAAPHTPDELRRAALHWLIETDTHSKACGVRLLHDAWQSGTVSLDPEAILQCKQPTPGRPAYPTLVDPRDLPHRSMRTAEGRGALLHALAHIEFNAINLALDAIWRFPGMPQDYYTDWLRVAAEEAFHFSLLDEHLVKQGFRYGDFPAHNGLWEMAEKTRHDPLARMALVPRTLEARGLDASPQLRAKLAQAGDHAAADILGIILRDEIGHVAVGNRWYNMLCRQRGLDPVAAYAMLAAEHDAPTPRGPFNLDARRAAGFTETELAVLAG